MPVTRPALSRRRAIPLAVGSIAGSGILFLPSAVYVEAGRNSLVVWAVATLTCLPMLAMFEDLVTDDPSGAGIESLVRRGLGATLARCVPVMFVALVVVGLPAGSMVAGRYAADALGLGPVATGAAGAVVLAVALVVNAAGSRTSARWQTAGTVALLVVAATIVVLTVPSGSEGHEALLPDPAELHVVAPGLLLAFWAFAGFENLTLLSSEMADPRRDFLSVSGIALALYGLLTILLTTAIARRVPRADVDEVTGLAQLADTVGPGGIAVGAVTAIALVSMTLNAAAWVWGVSRLVADAAERGSLPPMFAPPARSAASAGTDGWSTSSDRRPALTLLAGLLAGSATVLATAPGLVVDAVAAASAVFVVLYLLCIVAYVRVRGLTVRSGLNLSLLVILVPGLAESGWRAAYALAALAVALGLDRLRRTTTSSHVADRG